ncbi:hypothetical protein Tco_1426602 [Tanacetum coccineum]
MSGRPRKLRIKHVTERVNEVSRSGRMMTCQLCWQKGHSKKTCKNEPQPKPTKEKKKPERKKVGSTFVFPSGKAANDVDESDAGGGAGPSNAGGVQMEATVTEDPIEEFGNEISTQTSRTSMKEVVEASIAADGKGASAEKPGMLMRFL